LEGYAALERMYGDLEAYVELALGEEDDSVYAEARDLALALDGRIAKMRLGALLSGPYDKNNAILTIHPGAGGTESQDWAEMLLRMYARWGEKSGYTFKVLDVLDGEGAGIKNATCYLEGLNAYGYLRGEKGVHRLVRISPFDSSGRRHTSFASIEVIPDIADDVEVTINPADIKVETFRAGGAGGQHVNKTDSAIRVTHLPTGIVTTCQNERSQFQNKESALRMLKSRLLEVKERENKDRIEDLKGVKMDIAWGSQIRSYVFCPYTMVKDHRTGFETGDVGSVMDGGLDGFIDSYLNFKVKGDG